MALKTTCTKIKKKIDVLCLDNLHAPHIQCKYISKSKNTNVHKSFLINIYRFFFGVLFIFQLFISQYKKSKGLRKILDFLALNYAAHF